MELDSGHSPLIHTENTSRAKCAYLRKREPKRKKLVIDIEHISQNLLPHIYIYIYIYAYFEGKDHDFFFSFSFLFLIDERIIIRQYMIWTYTKVSTWYGRVWRTRNENTFSQKNKRNENTNIHLIITKEVASKSHRSVSGVRGLFSDAVLEFKSPKMINYIITQEILLMSGEWV